MAFYLGKDILFPSHKGEHQAYVCEDRSLPAGGDEESCGWTWVLNK
jgi:hypothetical protein